MIFQASIMQGCSIVQLQNSQGLMVVPSQATIATSSSPATQTSASRPSSQGPPDTTQRWAGLTSGRRTEDSACQPVKDSHSAEKIFATSRCWTLPSSGCFGVRAETVRIKMCGTVCFSSNIVLKICFEPFFGFNSSFWSSLLSLWSWNWFDYFNLLVKEVCCYNFQKPILRMQASL